MFPPGPVVIYTRTSGNLVLTTVVGPSPRGDQFIHLRYKRTQSGSVVDNSKVPLISCTAYN